MSAVVRRVVIAGNWKMNKKASEVAPFEEELEARMSAMPQSIKAVLCVPFPLLPAMLSATGDCALEVGAQDVSEHDLGAYTGEVSAEMLRDLGVKWCIIGHSERRAYMHETDGQVNRKLAALLHVGITPIVCVGESAEQREMGLTKEFIAYQVKAALFGIVASDMPAVVLAYEPIWAIGTGKTATAAQAEEVCSLVRQTVAELYGDEIATKVSILYGGSMNAQNAAELLAMPDIDGGLIGGASLKTADFASILMDASELKE